MLDSVGGVGRIVVSGSAAFERMLERLVGGMDRVDRIVAPNSEVLERTTGG